MFTRYEYHSNVCYTPLRIKRVLCFNYFPHINAKWYFCSRRLLKILWQNWIGNSPFATMFSTLFNECTFCIRDFPYVLPICFENRLLQICRMGEKMLNKINMHLSVKFGIRIVQIVFSCMRQLYQLWANISTINLQPQLISFLPWFEDLFFVFVEIMFYRPMSLRRRRHLDHLPGTSWVLFNLLSFYDSIFSSTQFSMHVLTLKFSWIAILIEHYWRSCDHFIWNLSNNRSQVLIASSAKLSGVSFMIEGLSFRRHCFPVNYTLCT